MLVESLEIPEVKRITPPRHEDARGWFCETWNSAKLAEHGLQIAFVQDNLSRSTEIGTVRGLHFQAPPFAQGKLVRVPRGRVIDVAVDIRKGSGTYGRWVSAELSEENGAQLWVPPGFLHGFATLEPMTEVAYKVTAPYARDSEGSVRFNDADLAIDWGLGDVEAKLSDKDAAAPLMRDFSSPFTMENAL